MFRVFSQARCFPEAEFFGKILVGMLASEIRRKKKITHFDSVKTLQWLIWMRSHGLASWRGALSSLQFFCKYLFQ